MTGENISVVQKQYYKMRCDSCQWEMSPMWTMHEIHDPCCSHVITVTPPPPGKRENLPATAISLESGRYGNRQCLKFESFYNRVTGNMSDSYHPGLSSHRRLALPAPNGALGKFELGRPSKRAVLCGVTYRKRKYTLKGTLNDVKNMKQFLMQRFGFLEPNIRILTEEAKCAHKIPTKKNILDSLDWLIKDSLFGDSLVFYFSGHGVRTQEITKGDELDGFNVNIYPVDFAKEGLILDNDLNTRIVRPLTKGVTLHAIVDACYSGTILDLPNVYDFKSGNWLDNISPSGANKGTMGGLAISLSAWADAEIAADTSVLTGWRMSSAMTYNFVHAVTQKQGSLSYGELLRSMHNVIEEANTSKWLMCHPNPKLLQEPVLSSSEIFDVNRKIFYL